MTEHAGAVSAFWALARLDPSAEAACGPDWSMTRRDLAAAVDATAGYLSGLGLGPQSRVGLTISDERDHLIAMLALLQLGSWQIALASHDTTDLRLEIARHAQLNAVLIANDLPATGNLPVFKWRPPDASGVFPFRSEAGAEGGVVFRTSGTTGGINLVPVSSLDILLQAGRHKEYRAGRLFRPASIEHNNSRRHRLYCNIMGGVNVFAPKGRYDLAEYCCSARIDFVDIALMHVADLTGTQGPCDYGDIAFRVSGSGMPWHARKLFEQRVSPNLYVRYGATESGTIAVASPGQHDESESVGQVVAGIELQLVDTNGLPVKPGDVGEIRLRGPGVASAYFNSTSAADEKFRDGWFWPGDMGQRLPNGDLAIKGRVDDMMILNGINIFPVEIERVLLDFPGVAEAAAAGLKSANHGDIPVAAIVAEPGQLIDLARLMLFARDRLSLRAPRRIEIVEQLPRNSQGKVLRRQIATLFDRKRSQ